ncbi:MAG: RHS repeat-associated core domain-containing protein, partial [Elusimicrobia bacterium]|nr:RHS repeat-associated core domain-containing protein [Elusimicrobiota bacterium]
TVSGNVARAYDPDFALISQSVDGAGTVSFAYDQDKLLTQAGDETLTRDPQDGLLAASALGNVSDAWTYDGFGAPAAYAASANSAPIFSDQFTTRDNLGRIVQKSETVNGTTHVYAYTYNTAGQLAGVSVDGSAVSAYTYDGNGNRLTASAPAIGSKTCTYDAQDRLTSCSNGESYTYTANGELLSKTLAGATTSYAYDVLGNLISATLPGGTTVLSYVIDGQNRRVGKLVNGVLTQGFLYDGQLQIVAQIDGANNVISRFVYGSRTNVPDYMIQGGVEYRIIADNLGSPRLVVNSQTGAVVQEMDYDEFGNVTNDTNPGFQPFGFAGGLYDQDLKLVRFGSRDYDPESGRWTAKDPIGFKGGDFDLYGYVLADPINLRDPYGLAPGAFCPLPPPPPILIIPSNPITPGPGAPGAASGGNGGNGEECELDGFLSVIFNECLYICPSPPVFETLPKPAGGLQDCQPFLPRL